MTTGYILRRIQTNMGMLMGQPLHHSICSIRVLVAKPRNRLTEHKKKKGKNNQSPELDWCR